MRTLVSGASGFIGRALLDRLRQDGHDVSCIVRHDPRPGDVLFDAASRSLDASRLPGGTLDGFDAVFHLAGAPIPLRRWGARTRELIRASRVTTTLALARALAATDAPPPVLVCASAIGIYGERGEEVLDEQSAAGEGFLAEVCRAWEAAAAPARAAGIRVVAARTGLVLGAGGGLVKAQLPAFRAGLGARLGSGRQWQSWISLTDEIEALLHAAACDELDGPCDLVAPEPVRNAELTDALAAALGRRARLALPAPLLALALGESAREMALASQRVIPRRLQETGFTHRLPDLHTTLVLATRGARD